MPSWPPPSDHTRRHTAGWWSSNIVHRNKERPMPLINVKVIEGVFTPEQKTQIAERLTDAMVSVEGENMRGVTWCVIDEVKSGAWAIGGQCLTTEAVHALAAGQPA